MWITKEEGARKIDQFIYISLLITEGKTFFSILNRRLISFLQNNYIDTSVQKKGVPNRIYNLIIDYYNSFKMRTITKGFISEWHNLEKGIITGCTISATLFTQAMNLLIKTVVLECRGPVTRSAVRQSTIRA